MAGMAKKYPIKILNISIEMESEENVDKKEWKQFKEYIQYLWDMNILIVAAAGNKGPDPMTLSPIGECSRCVCVGCNDGNYTGNGKRMCSEYSSRGPGKDLSGITMMNPLKSQILLHQAQISYPAIIDMVLHHILQRAALLCLRRL